jgi:hypothetical protein
VAVGFDPGAEGGFAILTPRGVDYVCTLDTKCLVSVWECLDLLPCKPARVVVGLESVHGRWGWGARSIFGLGGAFWVVKSSLLARDIDFEEIVPVRWQRELWGTTSPFKGKRARDDRKRAIIDAAEAKWPDWHLRSGEADAIWIAHRVAVEQGWVESQEPA